jgi:chromosome segregation ATPase
MDAPPWLYLIIACTLACAATLGGCVWWFGRRLAELNLKLSKVDKARQFSSHQAAQARKQLEKLQAELVFTQQQRDAGRAQQQQQAAKQRVEALDILLASADAGARAPVPANGFADTQPMLAARTA